MAENAQDLLKQMRKERTATSKPEVPEDHYFSKILISKPKRATLIVALLAAFFFFSTMIFADQIHGGNWIYLLGPVAFIGFLITLIPLSEEWSYKPWQSFAQKYERHFSD